MKAKHILWAFLFMLTATFQAQVKFEAKVSKKKLGINERLRVDFEMNEDGDNFAPPLLKVFGWLEGPIRLSVIRGSTANAVFPKPIPFSSHPNPKGILR